MNDDPVVEEVRKAREAYASVFGFDIDAIVDDLQRQTETARVAGAIVVPKRKENQTSFDLPRSKQVPA